MKNNFPIPVVASNLPFTEVAPGVMGLQILMVNVYFVSADTSSGNRWFLIDAGMGECAERIKNAAELLYGPESKPEAILLTHGHLDHIGALVKLADEWQVPVYAHPLEIPYITNISAYPPPDPTVGGGALAAMSPLFSHQPINYEGELLMYPEESHIPNLGSWQVLHTPGHAPGHVSFFRESDKTLIAGDAVTTVKQESLRAVLTQRKKLHGPPAYFTCDWQAAERSVNTLAELQPEVVATGHGEPMYGTEVQQQLHRLSKHFQELVVPKTGRYVASPAITDERGVVSLPPAPNNDTAKKAAVVGGIAAAAVIALLLAGAKKKKRKKKKQSEAEQQISVRAKRKARAYRVYSHEYES